MVRLAKAYVEHCNAKASLQADTPMTSSSSLIDITPSELRLFTELTEEAKEHKLHLRKGQKGIALTMETKDNEDMERPVASIMTRATKCVVHHPAPKDCFDRVSVQHARNDDL